MESWPLKPFDGCFLIITFFSLIHMHAHVGHAHIGQEISPSKESDTFRKKIWTFGTGVRLAPYITWVVNPIATYSISQEICTRFLLCCTLLWLYIAWFPPYPSGLLHWHCGNLTIAPVPAKQPWWIWINTSCEFIMNDCLTTTKQSTTKPCAYFLGYTVSQGRKKSCLKQKSCCLGYWWSLLPIVILLMLIVGVEGIGYAFDLDIWSEAFLES